MVAAKIKYLVKKALKDFFKPASEVINDIVLKELTDTPCPTLSHLDSLQRTAVTTARPLTITHLYWKWPNLPSGTALDLPVDLQSQGRHSK